MTLPDTNTISVIGVNIVGYVWVWMRTRRKDTTDDSVRIAQHVMMWKDYLKRHGIANGEGRS